MWRVVFKTRPEVEWETSPKSTLVLSGDPSKRRHLIRGYRQQRPWPPVRCLAEFNAVVRELIFGIKCFDLFLGYDYVKIVGEAGEVALAQRESCINENCVWVKMCQQPLISG